MVQQVAQRFTGTSVKRVEDARILTGRGKYVDDVKLPDMVYAAFLRSPVAHANITRIDTDEARQAQGVLAVYTGVELERVLIPGPYGAAGLLPPDSPITRAWLPTRSAWWVTWWRSSSPIPVTWLRTPWS